MGGRPPLQVPPHSELGQGSHAGSRGQQTPQRCPQPGPRALTVSCLWWIPQSFLRLGTFWPLRLGLRLHHEARSLGSGQERQPPARTRPGTQTRGSRQEKHGKLRTLTATRNLELKRWRFSHHRKGENRQKERYSGGLGKADFVKTLPVLRLFQQHKAEEFQAEF
ncbi:hypothetical protein P7K49_040260 [Saguinus oedipus]|uniref:Uncharacterized protein n=1 Tax=Saguinus oedipus TaxID=9490 RepID=A0ABQ9T9C3_SAGOE|nr:hypothetical protein P7K49_040260 [Saguinus oedipus]